MLPCFLPIHLKALILASSPSLYAPGRSPFSGHKALVVSRQACNQYFAFRSFRRLRVQKLQCLYEQGAVSWAVDISEPAPHTYLKLKLKLRSPLTDFGGQAALGDWS